jgi:hypothetical protein
MDARYELEPLHRNTPDDEFLHDLKDVAVKLGADTVSISQYNSRGRFNASSLQRRFGSWRSSLERAGLVAPDPQATEEQLFDNLVEVWARLGRQPRLTDMTSQNSRISGDTYRRRYGGWRTALEAFVVWANKSDVSLTARTATPAGRQHKTPRNINYRLRFLVMRRDNFKCCITGRSPATDPTIILVIDHIVPWDKGGETLFENLQTLAQDINIGKSNLGMEG